GADAPDQGEVGGKADDGADQRQIQQRAQIGGRLLHGKGSAGQQRQAEHDQRTVTHGPGIGRQQILLLTLKAHADHVAQGEAVGPQQTQTYAQQGTAGYLLIGDVVPEQADDARQPQQVGQQQPQGDALTEEDHPVDGVEQDRQGEDHRLQPAVDIGVGRIEADEVEAEHAGALQQAEAVGRAAQLLQTATQAQGQQHHRSGDGEAVEHRNQYRDGACLHADGDPRGTPDQHRASMQQYVHCSRRGGLGSRGTVGTRAMLGSRPQLQESTMNTKLPYHRYHLALLTSLFDTLRAQTVLMAQVPEESNELFLERFEELITQLEAGDQDALYSGQEIICQVISRYPQVAHLIPRDLLWYFGCDCLHLKHDEEIAHSQPLDDHMAEPTARDEEFNREQDRQLLMSQARSCDTQPAAKSCTDRRTPGPATILEVVSIMTQG